MKKQLIATAFLLLGLFSHCSDDNEERNASSKGKKLVNQDQPTPQFINYLKAKFHTNALNSNGFYIVVPDNGCSSCSVEALVYIATEKPCKNVSLVVSNSIRRLPKSSILKIKNNVHYMYADTAFFGKNELDRLDLPFTSFSGVVSIKNNQLHYRSFDINNYKQVISNAFYNN
jgi:hypothetical protein